MLVLVSIVAYAQGDCVSLVAKLAMMHAQMHDRNASQHCCDAVDVGRESMLATAIPDLNVTPSLCSKTYRKDVWFVFTLLVVGESHTRRHQLRMYLAGWSAR